MAYAILGMALLALVEGAVIVWLLRARAALAGLQSEELQSRLSDVQKQVAEANAVERVADEQEIASKPDIGSALDRFNLL